MFRFLVSLFLGFGALGGVAGATTFTFNTDPFAGSTALTTPGRQVVGGEPSIAFVTASDQFLFDLTVFGIGDIQFVSDVVGNLPTGGVNVIVLQSLDDDANPATGFGAGNAASLIAAQLTSPGAGFFIYFNSGLNLPRLVWSTDLNDPTADLKILARMTNFAGNPGALTSFGASNFAVTPVPPAALLMAGPLIGAAVAWRRRRKSALA